MRFGRFSMLALALAAGAVDALSFLALGQVFTANMTGNVVLLGLALGTGDTSHVIRSGIALTTFCLGLAIGFILLRGTTPAGRAPPPPQTTTPPARAPANPQPHEPTPPPDLAQTQAQEPATAPDNDQAEEPARARSREPAEGPDRGRAEAQAREPAEGPDGEHAEAQGRDPAAGPVGAPVGVPVRPLVVLLAELALLVVVAAGWTARVLPHPALIAASGTAMGLQSAVTRWAGGPGLSTTYVTGTLTSLAGRAVGPRSGMLRPLGVVLCVASGAVAAAAALRVHAAVTPFIAPATVAAATAAWALTTTHRTESPPNGGPPR
ncbi:YoaK family protein [Nonomuraea sp. NPDC049646]|uniref:YoaK family protein n=1 Tax=unclassified Nonomuraea TaxID=2593643 RepID=UPI00379F1BA8